MREGAGGEEEEASSVPSLPTWDGSEGAQGGETQVVLRSRAHQPGAEGNPSLLCISISSCVK